MTMTMTMTSQSVIKHCLFLGACGTAQDQQDPRQDPRLDLVRAAVFIEEEGLHLVHVAR